MLHFYIVYIQYTQFIYFVKIKKTGLPHLENFVSVMETQKMQQSRLL